MEAEGVRKWGGFKVIGGMRRGRFGVDVDVINSFTDLALRKLSHTATLPPRPRIVNTGSV